jgi:hypothetical protein
MIEFRDLHPVNDMREQIGSPEGLDDLAVCHTRSVETICNRRRNNG